MSPIRNACILAAGLLLFACGPARAGVFVTPISGVPFEDWAVVHYVDLTPGSGISDYRGGAYTYEGHGGVDYVLANFAQMDQGVPVLAAAAGTVIAVEESRFDRNYLDHIVDTEPNYVIVDHGDGLWTNYVHLRKDSVDVSVGQVVSAGQQIGLVGSSGYSYDPHLHFEATRNGNVISTYADPGYWWTEPLAYAGDMPGSLDHGMTDHLPDNTEIHERPERTDVFRGGDVPYLWLNLHGVEEGDSLDFYFYRPDGVEQARSPWQLPEMHYGWWAAGFLLPNEPQLGTWTVDARLNGVTVASDSFQVVLEFTNIPGDANGNSRVDQEDAKILAAHWGQSGGWARGDFNNDGVVNALDASILAANWGHGMRESAAVPEPSALALLTALLFLAGSRLRRSRELSVAC
ncbi:MAG: peptidoglycan DD-metalloendopeptidase family protein [Pirellulaceae bacterium]|nr:peptidoglycan DD-metalloendopeptidase family protein [Pirellulaceae bacterium]